MRIIRKKPNWPYWWAIADTLVELQHCVALSFNINPHVIPRGRDLMNRWAFASFIDDVNTIQLFWTRLRILYAHRVNGDCFSPIGARTVKESVLLREFSGWALQKFREPEIPTELAVLGVFGKATLPEPEVLEKIVATWRFSPTRITPSEMASFGEAYTKSNDKNILPSIVRAPSTQRRRRISIEAQKVIILEAIVSLNFDPMRFPKSNYVNGAKKAVFNACIGRLTKSQFLHTWQELREERKIIDIGDKIAN